MHPRNIIPSNHLSINVILFMLANRSSRRAYLLISAQSLAFFFSRLFVMIVRVLLFWHLIVFLLTIFFRDYVRVRVRVRVLLHVHVHVLFFFLVPFPFLGGLRLRL